MPDIFVVTDPRGRRIVCTQGRWHGHIILKHPFLIGWRKKLPKAIEEPDVILKDADFVDREVYYFLTHSLMRKKYIKVVVRFNNNDGEVVTVFFADKPKTGEILLWPK